MLSTSSSYIEKRAKYAFKIVTIGDPAVGKTSLVLRYTKNTFSEQYIVSLGVNFLSKVIKVNGESILLQIWDTGGQERFKVLRLAYYKGADGGLIVYDVTSKETFEKVDEYYEELRSICGDIPIALVGNKVDLQDNREVSREEGMKKANELKLLFFETSAKENINVEKAFGELAHVVYEKQIKKLRKEEVS
ncbi:MAG: Rab family GTPase [Candidatus Asgardarchaeia archaeon]